MKDELIESALDSKVYGISNIVRVESPLLKIIWIISFVASAIACIYLIVNTIIIYLENNVIPMISIKYEVPSRFPAVNFCNLGKIFDKIIKI